jgi:hypothetical protein
MNLYKNPNTMSKDEITAHNKEIFDYCRSISTLSETEKTDLYKYFVELSSSEQISFWNEFRTQCCAVSENWFYSNPEKIQDFLIKSYLQERANSSENL